MRALRSFGSWLDFRPLVYSAGVYSSSERPVK